MYSYSYLSRYLEALVNQEVLLKWLFYLMLLIFLQEEFKNKNHMFYKKKEPHQKHRLFLKMHDKSYEFYPKSSSTSRDER